MDVAISVSAKRCAVALGVVVALLVVTSIAASFLSFMPIENSLGREATESFVRLAWVDGEGNIPTWYSSSILLLCSLLLALIALAHRYTRSGSVLGWLLMSFIFAFLSIDETAQLHELSIVPLRLAFRPTGLLYYGWIIPAGICLVVFVVGYARFLARLPRRTRGLFLLAGVVFVAGAIGVEAVSGMHASLRGEHTFTYHLLITLEELLEMAGIVLFIYGLLDYISREFSQIWFRVSSS
jgi:hypothetical protein